jgi:hypothetical protein
VYDSYQDELRRYEGIIYDLEYQNQILCDENERLKKRLDNAALGKPEKTDEGPRLFPRISPRAGSSTKPDDSMPDIDLSPPNIEHGPTSEPSRSTPGSTKKPVTPEDEPPVEHTQPNPEESTRPKPAVETLPKKVEPLPKKAEPLPDIDAPPGSRPSPLDMSDEPPPKVPSILRPPGNKTPTSETLPAPRPTSTRPRVPELLPAPDDKKGAAIFSADVRAAGFESRPDARIQFNGAPSPESQQRWTPRSPRRAPAE